MEGFHSRRGHKLLLEDVICGSDYKKVDTPVLQVSLQGLDTHRAGNSMTSLPSSSVGKEAKGQ